MNALTTTVATRLPMPAGFEGSPSEWRVLCEAIFPAAKSAEAILLAIAYCRARGFDILKRPVHIVPMWNAELRKEVETVWAGINSIQVEAARTGAWAGMDPPVFGPDITRTFRASKEGGNARTATVTFPLWCEQTVWRLVQGARCAFTERVYWVEAYGRWRNSEVPNDMWGKRPHGQLHKCAKAAVLRTAFPEAADYSAEEMEGREIAAGGNAPKDITPAPAPETAEAGGDSTLPPSFDGKQEEPQVREIIRIVGMDGQPVYTGSIAREALAAFGQAKQAWGADPTTVARLNFDALKLILPHVRNGNHQRLKEVIETLEATMEAAEPEIDPEVAIDQDGVVIEEPSPTPHEEAA
jgi:phage recombination protein Bet